MAPAQLAAMAAVASAQTLRCCRKQADDYMTAVQCGLPYSSHMPKPLPYSDDIWFSLIRSGNDLARSEVQGQFVYGPQYNNRATGCTGWWFPNHGIPPRASDGAKQHSEQMTTLPQSSVCFMDSYPVDFDWRVTTVSELKTNYNVDKYWGWTLRESGNTLFMREPYMSSGQLACFDVDNIQAASVGAAEAREDDVAEATSVEGGSDESSRQLRLD